MKKLIRNITLLLVVIAVTQCRKDEPGTHINYSEDVVFYLKGNVDGQPLEIKAGQNNYSMTTSYYFEDSVVEMRGSLLPDNGTPKSGFEIRVRGEQRIESLAAFDPSVNFEAGSLALRDATNFGRETGKYLVSLRCDTSQGQYSSHLWIFPDGTYSNAYYLEKIVDVNDYPSFPVRLETSGAFACQSEVYHEINLKADCDAGFDVTMLAPFSVAVNLKNIQGTIDHIDWYHNDLPVVPSATDHSIYLGNTGNPHVIRCEVFFTNNCKKVMERKLSANFSANCVTDFQYQTKKEAVLDPQDVATVEIIYYDENGKKYSSHYQDAMGEFELISFVPYLTNDAGDPTMHILFEADAILKSTDGSSLTLTNVEGSFALAYP